VTRPNKNSNPATEAQKVSMNPDTSLVLRVCAANMTSSHEFKWPGVGEVAIARDWNSQPVCGQGLHGWLHGAGEHDCTSYWQDENAKWLVVEVETASIIQLGGKVKFPSGVVRFVGARKDATDYLLANDPRAANVAVIGAQRQVGDKEPVIVGALGTATAGDRLAPRRLGTAAPRRLGTAAPRRLGTAAPRRLGTAAPRRLGTAAPRRLGTAAPRRLGTAAPRRLGTAAPRRLGPAAQAGTATAGYSGTATAGYSGTATAGELGEIRIRWWDAKNDRYRTVIGYVGEGGIEPNVAYRLDAKHQFVRAKP
jgi:hypothetical protein